MNINAEILMELLADYDILHTNSSFNRLYTLFFNLFLYLSHVI